MSQKGEQSSMEIGDFSSATETVLVVENDPDPSQNVPDPTQNESQESPTWSETPDPEGITSPVLLPEALKHLYSNGLRFKKTPEFIWNRDSEQPRLVKNCSVYFSVDSVCSSQEILQAFDKAGIDIDEISSIQRKASNKSWVVTFDSAITKEDALEVATIEIGGVPVFLGDCENRVVLVKIYEAPAELPDTALIGRLSYYRRVLSFRRDRIADSINNGVRTARMRLHRHVPSTINLASEFIRIWYPTQPKTCRNCGSDEHMVKHCDSMRCFNCEQPGHHSRNCELPVLCTVCKDGEHDLNNCPFVLYSANIDVSTDANGSATKRQDLVNEQRMNRQERKEQAKQATKAKRVENTTRASAGKTKDSASASSQQQSNRSDRPRESTDECQHRKGDESQRRREDGSHREDRERRDDRREERERSRQSERRDRDREEDRRERRERDEFEEWKASKRRDEERFERGRSDHYHRRDFDRDRSSRREYHSDEDDDHGWQTISRRRRKYN